MGTSKERSLFKSFDSNSEDGAPIDDDQVQWEKNLEKYSRYKRLFEEYGSQNPVFGMQNEVFSQMTKEQQKDKLLYNWQRLKICAQWPKLISSVNTHAFLYEKERFGIESDDSIYLDTDEEREDLLNYEKDHSSELAWYLIDPESAFSKIQNTQV